MKFKSLIRKFKSYVLSKNLLNQKTLKNQWINETKIWFFQEERLCVKCNHVSHVNKKCKDNVLSAWKQFYLKSIVFEESSQLNFAMILYKVYDENISAYEMNQSTNMGKVSSQEFMILFTFISSFIKFKCADLKVEKNDSRNAEIKAIKIFYEKDSDFNKRSYLQSIIEQ